MVHKWDKHYGLAFALMLFSGIGLCVGGIWLAPLLIPGAVCLAGAFGMYASANVRMYPWEEKPANESQEHENIRVSEPNVLNVNIDDHHVEFHPHYDMIVRPCNPSLEEREIHQAKLAPHLRLM